MTVSAGSLSKFVVGAPTSATVGSAFTLTVRAEDGSGNTITSYSSSVGLSASSRSISPTSTGTSGWRGKWCLEWRVDWSAAGSITITANDGSGHTGTASVTVSAGSLSKFVVGAPTSATVGSAFTLTVRAEDGSGNTITSYSSSVGLSASSGSISPTSTGTSDWVNGVWSSDSVTLSAAGSITITANDGSGHTGTASVTVNAGALATVSVSGPASVTAGGTATFTATGFDAEGNSLGVETASWSITSGAGGFMESE